MSERATGFLKDFCKNFELAIGQPFYSKQFEARCLLYAFYSELNMDTPM